MNRRLSLLLLVLCGALVVSHGRGLAEGEPRRLPAAEAEEPLAGQPSVAAGYFGIGYAQCENTLNCKLAETYAGLGAQRVKIANIQWGNIEPNPPTNGQHEYNWWNLDHLVSNWQAAGYEVWILLRARCDWAGVEPYDEISGLAASTMPQDEYLDDYQDWVRAVVERYDHDDEDDMGDWAHTLRAPVRIYEIESEAQIPVQWQGRSRETNIADYLELLGLAREAAQDAYADVQIVLAGVGTTDIFDDFPSDEQMEEHIAALEGESEVLFREAITFTQQTLAASSLYDIVEFHANSNYTGMYGDVEWIRGMMPESKPLWAGDASSAPTLVKASDWDFHPPFGDAGEQIYQDLKNDDPATVAWYRKEQAELTAKKLVVGLELGLGLVSPGNLTDWPELFSGKNWAYQGMVDGGVWSYDPEQDAPRPVFYTYHLLAEKLADATAVEGLRLVPQTDPQVTETDLGRAPEIYAYRVTAAGPDRWILWYDDYVYQQPGEAEGSVTLELPASSAVVTVTHIITELGQTAPISDTLPVVDGRITLAVTETPILVEGEGVAQCAATVDLNCDCSVDVTDVEHVASRWRSEQGDFTYEWAGDLNADGQINVADVMGVGAQWGAECPGSP